MEASAGDPDEKCVVVVQSGGDKGVDKLLSLRESESGTEFYSVSEVVKSGLGVVLEVRLTGQLRVKSHTPVGEKRSQGSVQHCPCRSSIDKAD